MDKKLKILVVDDDTDLLFLLKRKLAKMDVECFTAAMPAEGLEKATELNPDLVLLDLNLPKMSGFGFLREFKHRENLSKIPVIVLTSIADDEVSQEALNLGAASYLTKSCTDQELFDAIQLHTKN